MEAEAEGSDGIFNFGNGMLLGCTIFRRGAVLIAAFLGYRQFDGHIVQSYTPGGKML
ncbi:MAG TPA: hypothetical protein VFW25_12405 [Silvibacterium sp.]|nr:hypothetical protein [Silvibacterium sp.]